MKTTIHRRIRYTVLACFILFAIAISPYQQAYPQVVFQAAQRAAQSLHPVLAVESVGITVSDMDKAISFYSQVLPFQKISDVEVLGSDYEQLQGLFGIRMRVVKMHLGDEVLELTEYLTPKGKPIPIDSKSHDRWFQHIAIVVSDMDRAYQYLRQHKIQYTSTEPQRIPDSNKVAAGIRAFYFKDLDGHNLEIIYFPPGKGNPKWQKLSKHLFLGIDHTAIVVADTQASLKFYRDLLGFKLAGASMNHGIEQAHLNNVEGARLQISGLRAPNGIGIEFLEYLEPRSGRAFPSDARPNDVLHWQTTLVVQDVEAATQRLQANRTLLISPKPTKISGQVLGFQQGILVRDPDGHALRLVKK
ncbi:MAG: VOC family protein [Leptolyngbya sp. UWPOB_LEPTO1]|uniref:VOC family protein n=1 Tax=Leptolyngbya sp. UWPOB_LEPTO1 TaxID=2815653 RepID=UPI001AC1BC1E|nr:VOC family protein [Leptolyngbya sp. UWPOB_LEPTO1]MBN8564967.1 VOC family protein [Leptolyngbya sp. UWPOB_LEPTO1]